MRIREGYLFFKKRYPSLTPSQRKFTLRAWSLKSCTRCAGNANKGGVSLFKKEIPLPYTLPEKISIASEQLKELQCLPIALPARGGAALGVAKRFASASIIRCCAAVGGFAALRMRYTPCGCRFADLVEVQTNFRLLRHSTMRRAQQCRIPQAVCRRGNVTRASRW